MKSVVEFEYELLFVEYRTKNKGIIKLSLNFASLSEVS